MANKRKWRRHSVEFKRQVVERMKTCENVEALARELAGRNVTVNAVAPGFIATDMTDKLPDAVKTHVLSLIPLGKFGECEDIAAAVAFIASSEARYITGQVMTIDGGMAM